jgi:hypothetical protein
MGSAQSTQDARRLERFHAPVRRCALTFDDSDHENETPKIIVLANHKTQIHDFVKPVSYGRFIRMERRIAQAVNIRLWAIRIAI